MAVACGLNHGFVFGAVLVGFEQDFVELCAHRLRAIAQHQIGCPSLNLCLNLLLFLNRQQGLGQDVGGGFFESTFAQSPKVMWGGLQAQQGRSLLDGAGWVVEIHSGQVGKLELVFGREFVSQWQLHGRLQGQGLAHQGVGFGLVKAQPSVGAFDLDPFARIELHLQGVIGLGQDSTGRGLAGIVKQ